MLIRKLFFVENNVKTLFFIKVAQSLSSSFKITFICTTKSCYEIIKKEKNITPIYIDSRVVKYNVKNYCYLDFDFKELIVFDRVLSELDKTIASNTLLNINNQIRRKIDFSSSLIIGELTWAVERLIHKHAFSQGGIYIMPHTLRFPDNRFLFFLDHRESMFMLSDQNFSLSEETLILKQPYWSRLNKKRIKDVLLKLPLRFHKIVRDKTDYRNFLFWSNFKIAIRKKFLAYLQFSKRYILPCPENLSSFDFHLILNMEPERSNFMSKEWESQLEFVEHFFKYLPLNKTASVHLHPRNIVDGKTICWIKKNIHQNVRLFIGFNAIEFNKLFGMSGTLLVNHALSGRIVYSASDFYPTQLQSVLKVTKANLPKLLTNSKKDQKIAEKKIHNFYKSKFISNSYYGIIGDPYFVPSCMNPSNISNVSNAIKYLANSINVD